MQRLSIEYEMESLARINAADTDEIQRKSDKNSLWYNNQIFALDAIFLKKDVDLSKWFFIIVVESTNIS